MLETGVRILWHLLVDYYCWKYNRKISSIFLNLFAPTNLTLLDISWFIWTFVSTHHLLFTILMVNPIAIFLSLAAIAGTGNAEVDTTYCASDFILVSLSLIIIVFFCVYYDICSLDTRGRKSRSYCSYNHVYNWISKRASQ